MRAILIRHFATKGNLNKCYIGKTDQNINEGSYDLRFDDLQDTEVVFTSPMKRAKQTAEILFPKSKKIVINNLREMDFGVFEGKNYKDLENNQDYKSWIASNCLDTCPNGESKEQFSKRTCEAFCEIINYCIVNAMETCIIVAHGGTAMAVAENILEPKRDYFSVKLDFGESIEFLIDSNTFNNSLKAIIENNVRKK